MEGGKLFLEKMIDMKLSISTEKLDWTLSRVFALFRKVSSDYPSKYVYHACMGEDDFSVHESVYMWFILKPLGFFNVFSMLYRTEKATESGYHHLGARSKRHKDKKWS
jgi:hypothetical protein